MSDKTDSHYNPPRIENNTELELLANGIAEMYFILDNTGHILFINKKAIETLGYKEKKILHHSIEEITEDFNLQDFIKTFSTSRKGTKKEKKITFITSKRQKEEYSTKIIPKDDNGQYHLICSTLQDITDSANTFTIAFENSNEITFLAHSKDLSIFQYNEAFTNNMNPQATQQQDFEISNFHFTTKKGELLEDLLQKGKELKRESITFRDCKNEEHLGIMSATAIMLHGQVQYFVSITDTTEQEQSYKDLQISEKRYRELSEDLPEMICELDPTGKLLYANKHARDVFGYSSSQIDSGFDIFEAIHPDYREQAKKNFKKILTDGFSHPNEYVATNKSGENFPVLIYTNPIFNRGRVTGIRTVLMDITRRKEIELAMEKSLRQQEILSEVSLSINTLDSFDKNINNALEIIGKYTDVSRVYIFENDSSGEFTSNTFEWCNATVAPQLEELQDIPYSIIPSWKKLLVEEGIVFSQDIRLLPTDIRAILEPQGIQSIVVLPLYFQDKFKGFVGFDECTKNRHWSRTEIELLKTISHIISTSFQRRIAEVELYKREKENRAIIESIPDIIFHFDHMGTFLSYSSSNENDLILPSSGFLGKNLSDVFPEEFATHMKVAINECISNGQFSTEYKLNLADKENDYEARFIKINNNEVIAIVRDVSQSKEYEKQLRIALEKAEQANLSKSVFLANVSHEIRTPLNAIMGFSEVLIDKIEHPLYKSQLRTIMSSGKTLLHLINDILDLSKIEAGKIDIENEPMRLESVVHEIKQVFYQKVKAKNLVLETAIDHDIPAFLALDEIRIHQILFNLVGNAVKFTEKGYIKIHVSGKSSLDNNFINLTISITDTGIGIPENQQEDIFNSFTQQSGQSTRKYGGTGLGLAITKRLVEKFDGSVTVTSRVGVGSTFTVYIPDIEIVNEDHDHHNEMDPEIGNIRFEPAQIMIVDDVDYNITVLKNITSNEKFEYITASSGEKALEILQHETPDIIFMDLRMTGITGYQTTEILKKNPKFNHTPIIAFTASAMTTSLPQIKALFDGYLRKPVNKKQVFYFLKKHLDYSVVIEESQKKLSEQHDHMLSPECKAKLPQMIRRLESESMPIWLQVKDELIIFEIQKFVKQLKEIVDNYPCDIMKTYTTHLKESIDSFDVESIEKLLAQFPEEISTIKKIIKANNTSIENTSIENTSINNTSINNS